jgi:hypothetical protein
MPRLVMLTLRAAVVLVALQGCAALPLAAVGGAALESGAGAVVKTGTEITMGGTVHRTFTIPENAVRAAVLEAFDRAGVEITEQAQKDGTIRIVGKLHERTVRVKLVPLSAMLTTMTLVVKQNLLLKDRATTSELLEDVEQVLSENPSFARLLRRPRSDNASASPAL